MGFKKGQSSGGSVAVLLSLITLLIVLYILFLPPDARNELLGNTKTGSGGTTGTIVRAGSSQTIFSTSPGKLIFNPSNEVRHQLNPVQVYAKDNVKTTNKIDSVNLEKSWYNDQQYSFDVNFNDFSKIKDIVISMKYVDGNGVLIVKLNGNVIHENDINGNVDPIVIKKENLKENNKIELSLRGNDWEFWSKQYVVFGDVQVLANYLDDKYSALDLPFKMNKDELDKKKDVTLSFTTSCASSDKGLLTIKINGQQIYSQLPTCTGAVIPLKVTDYVHDGENVLSFKVEKGDYILSQMAVVTELSAPSNPTYYLEFKDSYFNKKSDTAICGLVDGICPDSCGKNVDKDCCFDDASSNFWCDSEPQILSDRCVSYVIASTCGRCLAGYENINGDPSDKCENQCGDDTDGVCPSDCSMFLDKDCCLKRDRFWCDDVPKTGLEDVCKVAVAEEECNICSSGFIGNGDLPDCSNVVKDTREDEDVLKSEFDVILKMRFSDDITYKKAEIFVNGHKMNLDTSQRDFSRTIDDFLEPGYNSIKIVQKSSFEISNFEIVLKRK